MGNSGGGKGGKGHFPGKGALLAAIAVILWGCGDHGAYTPPPPPKVTVSQPARQNVVDYLEFNGNTQAINTVQLRARVEGYLEKVLFQDGDKVKKGQLLFLIQQNTYEAQLREAEANILAQKARLFHAKTEFARFSKLVKENAASQTDVDRWQYERDAAQAAVQAAEAKRDLAKLNLDYTRVLAPFDGRIDRRLKDPGNLVGAGEQTVLAEVNQINPIYVYFTINERDLLRLIKDTREKPENSTREKWPVFFGLADEKGYPHQGAVDFAAISLTPTTGTLLVRGVFPNANGMILPGLFARVHLPVAERQALVVPEVAVSFDQQGPYVLVVDDKNVVERRGVTPGPQMDEQRVIEEGLRESDWVIVNGMIRAIPGKEVAPEKTATAVPQESKPGKPPVRKNGR